MSGVLCALKVNCVQVVLVTATAATLFRTSVIWVERQQLTTDGISQHRGCFNALFRPKREAPAVTSAALFAGAVAVVVKRLLRR